LSHCFAVILIPSLFSPWGVPRCLGSLQSWDSLHRLPWRNSVVPVVFRPGAKGMATSGGIVHPPTVCACACVCDAFYSVYCLWAMCLCLHRFASCRSSPHCVGRYWCGWRTGVICTRSFEWPLPPSPPLILWRRSPLAPVASPSCWSFLVTAYVALVNIIYILYLYTRRPKKSVFRCYPFCRANTDSPVTKIQLWASFGV